MKRSLNLPFALLLLFTLINTYKSAFSQDKLSGSVLDSTLHPISNVTVTYGQKGVSGILGFAISDGKGRYELNLKTILADSLWLKTSHLSYEAQTIAVANKAGEYTLRLKAKTDQLQEIIIKKRLAPIFINKDTINYIVDSLSAKQDRSIDDIIKKLPGVEMRGDRIFYNNKQINLYTIDKLNLMGSGYGSINKSLPFDAISKIQIIENNQPIKVLNSIMPSEQASLNLVLKKHNITSGSATVGAGLEPLLWDADITPITLMKGWQMLNTVQANNTGTSLLAKLSTLSSEDNSATKQLLNVQYAESPPFDKTKWLNNNSKFLGSNFILKDKKNVEWRGGISFVNELSTNESSSITNLITADQNILISDIIGNRFNVSDLRGNVGVEKNEKSFFLKESFSLGRQWENSSGLDVRNDNSQIDQTLKMRNFFITNRFNLTTKLGKQLITLNAEVSYGERPQYLSVTPGQFVNLLNIGVPYNMAFQNVQYKSLSTTNSLSFIKKVKLFTLNLNAGFSYNQDILGSNLLIDGKESGTDFKNNILFIRPKVFVTPILQFEKNKISINFSLPAEWQQLRADYNQKKSDSTTRFVSSINPSLNIRYDPSAMWQVNASSNYGNNFGDVASLYQSYILTSFSNLQRSGSYQVSHQNSLSASLSANYKNVLKYQFANIYFNYSRNRSDFIAQTFLNNLGLTYQELVAIGNGSYSYGSNADVAQYFSNIKTTLKLSGGWNKGVSDQLINQVFSPYTSELYNGKIEIENSFWKWITFSYSSSYQFSRNYYPVRKLNNVSNHIHHLETNIFPSNGQMLSTYIDYYASNLREQTNQIFLNMKYTFSIPKHKLDFSITCNNLLNTKRYISQYNTTYYLIYKELSLRPRQFLASIRFNFGSLNK